MSLRRNWRSKEEPKRSSRRISIPLMPSIDWLRSSLRRPNRLRKLPRNLLTTGRSLLKRKRRRLLLRLTRLRLKLRKRRRNSKRS